eukprot:15281367-Ditylum_brightwellii.AAC.1
MRGEEDDDDSDDEEEEETKVEPLMAAPSILALLNKLLTVSTSIAANPTASTGDVKRQRSTPVAPSDKTASSKIEDEAVAAAAAAAVSQHSKRPVSLTPPLLSTPLRKLWVDCVVLCHVCGDGIKGNGPKVD